MAALSPSDQEPAAADGAHHAFILVPGFSLMAFSSAIEALRAANLTAGRRLYRWSLWSESGGAVPSSGEIPVPTEAVPTEAQADSGRITGDLPAVGVLCGGDRTHTLTAPRMVAWLRALAQRGRTVGSISDGAFLLARAGLFDGHRSTIHWQCFDAYRERFPHLDARITLYEIDGKRFSCAGGTAALDLFLHLIAEEHGRSLAFAVAENYVRETIREEAAPQRLSPAFRYGARDGRLGRVILLMQETLERPLTIAALAEQAGTSAKAVDRLFQRHVGVSPHAFYLGLRVQRAAHLLRQTELSVEEIAYASGFASSSHLARHFRQRMGVSPLHYKNGT